jgi:serine/threonine-protein kinase
VVRNDGARFLLIEGGEFMMGAFDERNKDFESDEKPRHRVRLSSFYMQETEVTFGEFERFCKEKALHRNIPELKDGFYSAWDTLLQRMSADELRRHPAVGVTRKLAEDYAHHVGGELPLEAQWEFAARSRGKNQLYVWGNDPAFNKKANIQRTIVEAIETLPVGHSTDDRTEQGVLDLAGNVREWCRDVWRIYPEVEPGIDPGQGHASDDANSLFVIRGGSYDAPRESARSTWRRDLDKKEYRAKRDHYDFDLGFRVVLEILEIPEHLIAHSESKTGSAGERGQ